MPESMTLKNNKRKFKVGQLVVASSHAGVDVKIRLTRRDDQDLGWFGVLVDKDDAQSLKNAGVPWIEPEQFETFTFDYQIVKLVYNKKGKDTKVITSDGKRIIRKRKPRKKKEEKAKQKKPKVEEKTEEEKKEKEQTEKKKTLEKGL